MEAVEESQEPATRCQKVATKAVPVLLVPIPSLEPISMMLPHRVLLPKLTAHRITPTLAMATITTPPETPDPSTAEPLETLATELVATMDSPQHAAFNLFMVGKDVPEGYRFLRLNLLGHTKA